MLQKTEVPAYHWLFPPRTYLILATFCASCVIWLSHLIYTTALWSTYYFFHKTLAKIGLAYWSWSKVKRRVSGGTRTNRRPPECWAHYIWAKYSLPFLVPGFLSSFCPWSVCLRRTLATSISRSCLPMEANGCSQTNEIRRERGGMWMINVACHISKQSMLCHLATSHYRP